MWKPYPKLGDKYMNELEKTFSKLRSSKEGGLIAYITAGDPKLSFLPNAVGALVDGGADIIELGVPFSDPLADGKTIQAASFRALKKGISIKTVIEMAGKIKDDCKTPIVLLTYYNPVFRMGLNPFFESAQANSVCGVIIPDLPIEEGTEYKKIAEKCGIDTIFFATPLTSADRLKKILDYTSGFLYLISVLGVTGIRQKIQKATVETIKKTNAVLKGKTPLAVGFGISKPQHVKEIITNGADAAIVGSGFVKIMENKYDKKEEMLKSLETYAYNLKQATKKSE